MSGQPEYDGRQKMLQLMQGYNLTRAVLAGRQMQLEEDQSMVARVLGVQLPSNDELLGIVTQTPAVNEPRIGHQKAESDRQGDKPPAAAGAKKASAKAPSKKAAESQYMGLDLGIRQECLDRAFLTIELAVGKISRLEQFNAIAVLETASGIEPSRVQGLTVQEVEYLLRTDDCFPWVEELGSDDGEVLFKVTGNLPPNVKEWLSKNSGRRSAKKKKESVKAASGGASDGRGEDIEVSVPVGHRSYNRELTVAVIKNRAKQGQVTSIDQLKAALAERGVSAEWIDSSVLTVTLNAQKTKGALFSAGYGKYTTDKRRAKSGRTGKRS